jgi:hypothetical protein
MTTTDHDVRPAPRSPLSALLALVAMVLRAATTIPK